MLRHYIKLKEMGHKGGVIIKTSDSDVIVLYVQYFPQMKNTANYGSRWEMYLLCSSLSDITCKFISAAHAVSECDTTSSFFGIGKTSVFNVLKETADYFKDLDKLRNSDKDEAFTCSRILLSRLYDQNKTFKRDIMTGTKGV